MLQRLPEYTFLATMSLTRTAKDSGAFIYSCNGVLSGIEVYGLSGDAPHFLPAPLTLRPLSSESPSVAGG